MSHVDPLKAELLPPEIKASGEVGKEETQSFIHVPIKLTGGNSNDRHKAQEAFKRRLDNSGLFQELANEYGLGEVLERKGFGSTSPQGAGGPSSQLEVYAVFNVPAGRLQSKDGIGEALQNKIAQALEIPVAAGRSL